MNKSAKIIQLVLIILISLLPVLYLALKWQEIPAIVPMHFNSAFEPDSFGDKSSLFYSILGLSCLSVFMYLLLTNISKIDPKRYGYVKSTVFSILGTGLSLFLTALNFVIIATCISQHTAMKQALIPLLGLLFVFLGVVMPSLKPNYFAGIRLPWTLSSNYNWHQTHKLAGWAWAISGILMVILSLLLPLSVGVYVLMSFMPILVGVPVVYSFLLFRKEMANPDIAKGYNEQE